MSTAAIVGGTIAASGIGAAGSIIAGNKAAKGADAAAQLQYQLGQQSIAEQKREFDTTQTNLAPFLKVGTQSVGLLGDLLKTPGQGLLTPWTGTFSAPTAEQARATPGYQFIQQAGSNAVQNSAAAQGGLLSTGAQKTLSQFNQGLADSTYSETYNRAFNEYLQGYNQFQNNQTNTFNRLAASAGMGQTTATTLGNLGQQSASNIAGINASTGSQVGNSLIAAGNSRASGYAGLANAFTGGIGNLQQWMLAQQMGVFNTPGTSAPPAPGGGWGVY